MPDFYYIDWLTEDVFGIPRWETDAKVSESVEAISYAYALATHKNATVRVIKYTGGADEREPITIYQVTPPPKPKYTPKLAWQKYGF